MVGAEGFDLFLNGRLVVQMVLLTNKGSGGLRRACSSAAAWSKEWPGECQSDVTRLCGW